jgi:hypothetical protein
MFCRATKNWQHVATELALLGFVNHVGLFTNHIVSLAREVFAPLLPSTIEICLGRGDAISIVSPLDDQVPSERNICDQCPICDGLVALHVALEPNIQRQWFAPGDVSRLALLLDDARRRNQLRYPK